MKKIMTFAMIIGCGQLFAAALEGQAGGDVVKRAMEPEAVVDTKSTPDQAPKSEPVTANARDAVKIGVIDKLVLVGDTSFCEAEKLSELLQDPLCDGTEKTVGDLKAAIVSTRARLAARGYYVVEILPSRADAYDDDAKTLELSVKATRFSDIKITMKNNNGAGDWYCERQIQKRFKYIKPGEPFNYQAFRQALRMINGHPDLVADTKLRFVDIPASAGSTNVVRRLEAVVEVDDSAPFHATVEVNNFAMSELHRWQMIATLQDLNLTGVEDVLSISPGFTFDGCMWSIAGSYMRPFELLWGGNWSVFCGYSSMDCDEIVQRMDLVGVGGFAGVNSNWNLYDNERRNVAFNIGIMWRLLHDQWTGQSVAELSRRDLHIVPLTIGFNYGDKCRDWLGGLDFASISESFNLYADRALFNRYSENADPQYAILRASWSRLQPLIGPETDGEEWRCWSAFQRLEFQYSQDYALISPERLAFGGNSCLRGYRTRGYIGDTGVYGTTEFRTPVWCNPVTRLFWPELATAVERCQFVIFTDYGWLDINDITTETQKKDEFLWSAGFGIRAALTKYASLNFDFAVPLRDAYASENDEKFELYFSVKFQY